MLTIERCNHNNTVRGPYNTYCQDCGEKLTRTPDPVDWNNPMEPGPVRFATREEAAGAMREHIMRDSRRALWHSVETERVPTDRVVIIARSYDEGKSWLISRLEPRVLPYIHGRPATHWAEDVLGTP